MEENINTSKKSTNDLNKGHRKRLRDKFKISKEVLGDYELLEMLLFYVFARKDTKNLAKQLLLKFNSLQDVINADEDQIKEIKGIGENVVILLKLIQEINSRIFKTNMCLNLNTKNINKQTITLNNIKAVKEYCKNKIGNLTQEEVFVLFLNNKCNLVAEEIITTGTINTVNVSNSLIMKKALNNAASKIILIHNHPSGDFTPSVQDIILTRNLKKLFLNFGIELLEHIVVSASGAIGIMESGMLD